MKKKKNSLDRKLYRRRRSKRRRPRRRKSRRRRRPRKRSSRRPTRIRPTSSRRHTTGNMGEIKKIGLSYEFLIPKTKPDFIKLG